ncbi:MAG: hypothetical protein IKC46_08345 [Lachnospiraceae bacterium]|nr:hypothetical protein [Lachnospiraceae bacterium]
MSSGIYFNKKNQKWIAQIMFKKKTHYLGSFRTLEEAAESRKKDEFSVNQLF